MSIQKTLIAGVAGTLLAGGAMAAEPLTLTDAQLDGVSAGAAFSLAFVGPFTSIGAQGLSFTELSQTASNESFKGSATGVQGSSATQAAAGLQFRSFTFNSAGSAFQSGGSAAVSFANGF